MTKIGRRKAKLREIPLDHGDVLTSESAEVARIWVTNGAGSSVWIRPDVLAEPEHFGYLMADTVRHASRAYAGAWGVDEGRALQAICDGLSAELREQFGEITTISAPGKLN